MSPKVKAFAINALRRAHCRWAPANAAWDRARVENPVFTNVIPKDRCRVGFTCAHCGGIFRKKEANNDHIIPIGAFKTLDIVAERLLVEIDDYQILCIPCHQKKSATEAGERAEERKK